MTSPKQVSRFAQRLMQAAAMGIGLVAALVLVGWHGHVLVLLRLHPAFIAMQYNTACTFLLLAAGLWSLAQGWRWAARACGAVMLLFSALILAQDLWQLDLGIDRLLFRSYLIEPLLAHPGRMAQATAVCFISCGILLFLATCPPRTWRRALQVLLSAGIFTLALSSVLGYLSGVDLSSGLGRLTMMALHTAVSFLAAGASLLVWSWGRITRSLVVAYAALLGGLLSVQTLFVFRHAEERQIATNFTLRADEHLNLIQRDLMRHLEAVESIGRFYAASQFVDAEEFQSFVEPMLAHLPGLHVVEWLPRVAASERASYEQAHAPMQALRANSLAFDPAPESTQYYPVTYVEPREGNDRLLGLDLGADPIRGKAIEAAIANGRIQVTGWLPLLQRSGEDLGFLAILPVRNSQQRAQGVVVGLFRAHRAFAASWAQAHGVTMQVYLADETDPLMPVYFRVASDGALETLSGATWAQLQQGMYRDQLIILSDRRWRMICVPDADWFTAQRTGHPWLAFGFGLLLTLICCLYLQALTQRTHIIAQEVAERTQELTAAHATLQASEERFRMLSQCAPVAIYLTDTQGRCLFVNEAWTQLSGQPVSAAQDAGWLKALHREDRARVLAEWQVAVNQASEFRSEYRCQRPEGTVVWVASLGVPVRDARGRFLGHVGTVIDATARSSAEQQRQAQQSLLARVTDAVPGVVYQSRLARDGTQRFLFVSRGAEALCGVLSERLLEDCSRFWSLVVPEDAPDIVASIQQSATTLEPWVHEFRLRTASGQLKWIWGQSIPETAQPDGSQLWNGLLLDVTEARRNQQQLLQFSNVVKQTEDLVLMASPDGVIEYVNPSFERLTGYTCAEVVGQSTRLIKSGKHPVAFYETLWRTLLQGHAFHAEFINRKKNGELYTEDKIITPIKDAQGRIAQFVAIGRDVTAKHQAALTQQRHMEELERFRQATIDREHRMIELKQQINQLSQELGRPAPQDLSFLPKNGEPS